MSKKKETEEIIETTEDNSTDAIFIRKVPVIFCEAEEEPAEK